MRFAPTSAGIKSAKIVIPNNDSDENPFNFSIQGTGAVASIAEPIPGLSIWGIISLVLLLLFFSQKENKRGNSHIHY